jgi:phosphomevalonate kinase
VANVIASAPGKLVLSGEYAVLDGAPAICMGINRRARVTIETHDEPWHRVVAPGFASGEGKFVAQPGGVEWLSGGEPYKLLEQVWREIGLCPDQHLSLTLDTREFLDAESGSKLGVGSSAALATSLATALCSILSPGADATRVASRAHRTFQGGFGSGVDVACSSSGGLIEFRMSADEYPQIDWPEGLVFAVLWSGVSTGTTEKLSRLRMGDTQPSHGELKSAAEQMAVSWRSGLAAQVLQQYGHYINALQQFSNDHDLGIFDAGHGALVDAAKDSGIVYKPCGAGGGDVGIALADNTSALASFVASPVVSGFMPLDVAMDMSGVVLCGDVR